VKTRLRPVVATCGLACALAGHAQPPGPDAELTPGAVLERGPHHNVLRTSRLELAGEGQVAERPARIVQLEDSANYWDEAQAQWAPAVAEIEIVRGIGVARRGQQQALFAPNANDPEGAVTITTRDGATLRSSVLALAFFDAASGRDVILASVQDALGELVPPNRILYRQALTGLVNADLIYEYRKSGVQQVVLLGESPPDPEEFGLLAEATRLEVLTEFFEAPTPTRRPGPAGGLGARSGIGSPHRRPARHSRAHPGHGSGPSLPVGRPRCSGTRDCRTLVAAGLRTGAEPPAGAGAGLGDPQQRSE
jgi:hypothetical protein